MYLADEYVSCAAGYLTQEKDLQQAFFWLAYVIVGDFRSLVHVQVSRPGEYPR